MRKFSRGKNALYIASLILLFHALCLFLFREQGSILGIVSDIFQTSVSILSGSWLYHKYLLEKGKDRKFWLFLSLTIFSYGLGMLCWDYYEMILGVSAPFPSMGDFFWLLMYAFIIIAFIYFIYVNRNAIRLGQMLYDTLIVFVVAAAASWEFIIKPSLLVSADQGILYKFVGTSYPFGNLGIIFVTLCVFNSGSIKLTAKLFMFIFAGTFSFLLADIWFLYLVSRNQYYSGHPVDLIWVLGILFIGVSTFYSKGNVLVTKEKQKLTKKENKNLLKYTLSARLWLPYLGVFFLFFLLIIHRNQTVMIQVSAILSIVLLLLRQIFTLGENAALLEASTELNKELEFKVQQRTKQLFLKNQQLQESIKQVEHMAFHDSLTKLPNRRYFEKYLDLAITNAREHNTKVAVLFLDLDRYKLVNDTLGHSIGDSLLQEVAQRLQACIGDAGIISRHGGDEFLVMLPNIDRERAAEVSENILQSLRQLFHVEGYELYITSSIGVSLFPDHGEESGVLTKRADAALYAAKKAYRNQHLFYDSSFNTDSPAELDLEKDIRIAIEKKEFTVAYQPLIEIQTGRMKGMETLIRWNHPHKGWISPEKFIPIAEESGFVIPIGLYVLETACRQWREWKDKGFPPLTVAVNISIKQFFHPHFLDQIRRVLDETGMAPEYLELEITENTFVSNHAADLFAELKKMGIKISIDDFGTGYSSLQYLKRLPINKLKIDQSFIRDIPVSLNDVAIVETIIAMAHHMNLEVVAEGVETREQLEFLRSHLCHTAQGYFFSKPLTAEEFETHCLLEEIVVF